MSTTQLLTLISSLILCLSPAYSMAINDTWQIIPGKQFGQITKNTSRVDLERIVNKEDLTDEKIYFEEDLTEEGTTLFKGTSKEFHIIWQDEKRLSPQLAIIRKQGSEWKLGNKISIGSTMQDIEQENKKPFSFNIHHNYYTKIKSWKAGSLENKLPRGKVIIRMHNEAFPYDFMEEGEEYLSNETFVKELKPKVSEIIIGFN